MTEEVKHGFRHLVPEISEKEVSRMRCLPLENILNARQRRHAAIDRRSRGENAPEVFARKFDALSAAIHNIVETDPLGVGFIGLRAECAIALSSQSGHSIDKQLALRSTLRILPIQLFSLR